MLSGNGLKAAQPCPARATEDRPRGTRRRAGKPRGIQCRTAAPGYFSPGLRYERPNLHDGSDDIGFRASWLAGDGPVRASSDIAPAASGSEECRVGKACVCTLQCRWSPVTTKTKQT